MTTGHPILAEFQAACQRHYACFIFACEGLHQSQTMFAGSEPDRRVFLSPRDPTKSPPTATLYAKDLEQLLRREGQFADALAKALIVSLYSDWEEYFRPRFAEAIGAKKNQIRCDSIGDIRIIRNCIVHDRSVLQPKHCQFKSLPWRLVPGQLNVSRVMFTELIDTLNQLEVHVLPDSAA